MKYSQILEYLREMKLPNLDVHDHDGKYECSDNEILILDNSEEDRFESRREKRVRIFTIIQNVAIEM